MLFISDVNLSAIYTCANSSFELKTVLPRYTCLSLIIKYPNFLVSVSEQKLSVIISQLLSVSVIIRTWIDINFLFCPLYIIP